MIKTGGTPYVSSGSDIWRSGPAAGAHLYISFYTWIERSYEFARALPGDTH